MLLKIEGDSALEVDVGVRNWSNMPQVVLGTVPAGVVCSTIKLIRISGDDDVCQL